MAQSKMKRQAMAQSTKHSGNKENARAGDPAAIRGVLLQTMIALLEIALASPPFEEITLEPSGADDHFGFAWRNASGPYAVQVKSSVNPFSLATARKWAAALEAATSGQTCSLVLLGPFRSGLATLDSIGAVRLEKKNLDIPGMLDQAAYLVSRFLHAQGLPLGSPDGHKMIAQSLAAKLLHHSNTRQRLTHAELVALLEGWVRQAPGQDSLSDHGSDSQPHPITRISITGFKSIQSLQGLELGSLNVLIGANGAGKSNFVSFFQMVGQMKEGRLQQWVSQQGAADRIATRGVKETQRIAANIEFGDVSYRFALAPTADNAFMVASESVAEGAGQTGEDWATVAQGQREAALKHRSQDARRSAGIDRCHNSISNWRLFHFHDSSEFAGMKRLGTLHDNQYLRPDAANLAAFLFRLLEQAPEAYDQIRDVVSLVVPFFDDFILQPQMLDTGEQQIQLLWRQTGSDYALWPSQLSDGSIRFICLATALLQPDPPSTIVIDEPELGLHPYAISLLGALLGSASTRMQVIVSTQSVQLLNEFSLENLIVVEREQSNSAFRRVDSAEFKLWMENYSIGDLWEMNILGGRP